MSGYHFTERVRHALALAREESARLGHEYVGTEHILLGLTRQDRSVALDVLQNQSIDVRAIQRQVDETVKRGKETGDLDRPYTSRAKKVLELAMNEARDLGHGYVGTEHLLLGLLKEEKGVAAQVLAHSGLTLDKARVDTLSVLEREGARAADGRIPGEGSRFATLVPAPRASMYQRTFVALWWSIGIVALVESVRLFLRALGMEGGTSIALATLAVVEALGAVLFLMPRTLKFGAFILLGVFALGFVSHLFRGDVLTQFLVYSAATLFVLAARHTFGHTPPAT